MAEVISMPKIDKDGFLIRGDHRASLRKLANDGPLMLQQCSDEMLKNYTDLGMMEPPLVQVTGPEIAITEAGRRALPPVPPPATSDPIGFGDEVKS